MVSLSPNMRGALFMTLGSAGFVFNDAIIKTAGGEIGLYQILFLRGLLATSLLGLLAWYNGAFAGLRENLRPMMGLRVLAEITATITFLMGLFHLPLATATAILQVIPLAVTLGAALFLSEPVHWRRYAAITAGFFGVILIIQPGLAGFSPWSLLLVGTVALAAMRDLATRRLPAQTPSLLVAFLTSLAITAVGGAGAVVTDWRPMTPGLYAMLGGAAIFLVLAYYCTIRAVRVGEISFSAPFRYTGLVWALVIGIVYFRDYPNALMLIGAAVVVLSGIYAFLRERRVRKKEPDEGLTFPGRLH